MATKMISFRADDEQIALMDAAAEQHGVSRSIWLREVVTEALKPEDGAASPAPHPQRALALQRRTPTAQDAASCVHPPTAHDRIVFTTVCRLCGTVLKTGHDGD